ncbi:fibronectin type III domain-containing protein [Paenibacillus sonchi]|uniref:fibronectin type III domain-containing protein n=1 Tax=Paenibacillus sonchi TaxID=373687 RepID=UPI001E59C63F|nr:fibronectin type III domain-containing protein [Paenibacillus sonchi]MCE3202639.1 fibronectin type III domain-containing protein [Paenibacillus sonchi]
MKKKIILIICIGLFLTTPIIYAAQKSEVLQYDGSNKLVKRIYTYSSGTRYEITYTYDNNGNLVSSKGAKFTPPPTPVPTGPPATPTPTLPPATPTPSIPTPKNFRIISSGTNTITVGWDAPAASVGVAKYNISIVSDELNITKELDSTKTKWTYFQEFKLLPKGYVVRLIAYTASGIASAPAEVDVGF